jgi:methionyl-tRNA formyltransferase
MNLSPVKVEAIARAIPIFQPADFRSEQAREQLRALAPDLLVVVAYGLILPPSVLEIPHQGCWNVHASLLPRWRGAAPIQRAIEAGDQRTGVCLMKMEKGLDTGPVLLSLETSISDEDTGGTLHDRLALLGAEVLGDGLKLLRAGMRPVARPQSEAGVTYARKLDKAEARLDWTQPAEVLARRVRAFNPWPVCEALVGDERLRIHAARALPLDHRQLPGMVLMTGKTGMDIACGEGALRLLQVQRDGGRPIAIADYLNARSQPRSS